MNKENSGAMIGRSPGRKPPPARIELLGRMRAGNRSCVCGDVIELPVDKAQALVARGKARFTDKPVGRAKLVRVLRHKPRVIPRHQVFDLVVEELPADEAQHLINTGRAEVTDKPLGPVKDAPAAPPAGDGQTPPAGDDKGKKGK